MALCVGSLECFLLVKISKCLVHPEFLINLFVHSVQNGRLQAVKLKIRRRALCKQFRYTERGDRPVSEQYSMASLRKHVYSNI